jgi:hypothetical protein
MNRRFLLASIATLSASRVVAQTMNPPAPAPSAGTDAQHKHITETMAVGSLSLLLSRMAQLCRGPIMEGLSRFQGPENVKRPIESGAETGRL